MSSAIKVAEANNQGVACMNNGEFLQAHHFFKRALESILFDFSPSTSSPNESVGTAKGIRPIPSFLEQDLLAQHRSYSCLQRHNASVDHALMYNHPIKLTNRQGCAFSTDPFTDATVSLSIIFFNLALLSHLQGIHCARQDNHLANAKTLYHNCWSVLAGIVDKENVTHGLSPLSATTGNLLIDLLSMAVWNNLAHISVLSYDYMECDTMIRQLMHRASLVSWSVLQRQSHGQGSPQGMDFLRHEARRFLLHAVSYRLYPTSTAAAA